MRRRKTEVELLVVIGKDVLEEDQKKLNFEMKQRIQGWGLTCAQWVGGDVGQFCTIIIIIIAFLFFSFLFFILLVLILGLGIL